MRREGAESSNTNDGVICNGCYRKYKLAQELQDGVGEKEAEDVVRDGACDMHLVTLTTRRIYS